MSTQVVTRFDLRTPDASGRRERTEMFERCVEQSAYADQHGRTAVTFSEHHGSSDGYLPAPLWVASAVAAKTTRIPITISALLVNLSASRRLAEDVAVLDLLSAGRDLHAGDLPLITERVLPALTPRMETHQP